MPDSPTPQSGDWAGYQRLVLAELERHNANMREIDMRLQAMSVDIALIKAQSAGAEEVAKKVRSLDQEMDRLRRLDTTDLEKRIRALEDDTLSNEVIERYRKVLIGMAATIVATVLIPLVRIYFGA